MKFIIILVVSMLLIFSLSACLTFNTGPTITQTVPPETTAPPAATTTPPSTIPPATTAPPLATKPSLPSVQLPKIALEDKTWVLKQYGHKDALKDAIEGKEPTARFDSASGLVSGVAVCNSYHANYTKNNENLTIGIVTSTLALCYPVDAAQMANQFMDALKEAKSYNIVLFELAIKCSGDRLLIFRAK